MTRTRLRAGLDTPLFVAAARGNTPILRLLLDAGAKPDHYTLRAAAFGGYGKAVRLFLAAGAPVDPDRGQTPLLNSLKWSREELEDVRTLLRDAGGRELPDWYLRWRWSLRYGWRWRLRRWLYAAGRDEKVANRLLT
jgi:Ankyrin repeats (3 copies)